MEPPPFVSKLAPGNKITVHVVALMQRGSGVVRSCGADSRLTCELHRPRDEVDPTQHSGILIAVKLKSLPSFCTESLHCRQSGSYSEQFESVGVVTPSSTEKGLVTGGI